MSTHDYRVQVLDDMRVSVDGYVFKRYGDPVNTMRMSIRLASLATYYWEERNNANSNDA